MLNYAPEFDAQKLGVGTQELANWTNTQGGAHGKTNKHSIQVYIMSVAR